MKFERIGFTWLLVAPLALTLSGGSARASDTADEQSGACTVSGTSARQAAGSAATPLEGTWRVTVTPDPGGPPPSQSYHTYLRGGGLIQSNMFESDLPGQGAWTKTGRGQFTLTFEKFVPFNPVTGQTGTFVFKVKEAITLQGDSYTGRGEGAFCDADGTNCISVGCASTAAQRMAIEAPACP
jgi:hypothetical protein